METIQVKKENLLKAYNKADAKGREMLTNLFGNDVVSRPIIERVTSLFDICDIANVNVDQYIIAPNASKKEKSINAYSALILIAEVLNEGWVPDYTNANQAKWYPWFKYSASGFSCNDYNYVNTSTTVSARLVFKSRELAEFAGKTFEKIYNDYLSI